MQLAEVRARAAAQAELLDALLATFGPAAASGHPDVDRWLTPRLAERLPALQI